MLLILVHWFSFESIRDRQLLFHVKVAIRISHHTKSAPFLKFRHSIEKNKSITWYLIVVFVGAEAVTERLKPLRISSPQGASASSVAKWPCPVSVCLLTYVIIHCYWMYNRSLGVSVSEICLFADLYVRQLAQVYKVCDVRKQQPRPRPRPQPRAEPLPDPSAQKYTRYVYNILRLATPPAVLNIESTSNIVSPCRIVLKYSCYEYTIYQKLDF